MVLKLWLASQSPGGLVKRLTPLASPQNFLLVYISKKSRGDADAAGPGTHTLRTTALDGRIACNSCVCACACPHRYLSAHNSTFYSHLKEQTIYCDCQRPALGWRQGAVLFFPTPLQPPPHPERSQGAPEGRDGGENWVAEALGRPRLPPGPLRIQQAGAARQGGAGRSGAGAPGRSRPPAARRPLPAARPARPKSPRVPGLEVSGGARRRTFPAPAHIW